MHTRPKFIQIKAMRHGTLAEYLKINDAMPDEAWCRSTIASLIENSGACMEDE